MKTIENLTTDYKGSEKQIAFANKVYNNCVNILNRELAVIDSYYRSLGKDFNNIEDAVNAIEILEKINRQIAKLKSSQTVIKLCNVEYFNHLIIEVDIIRRSIDPNCIKFSSLYKPYYK